MVWTRLILSIVGLFAHLLNGIDQCWTACIVKSKVFSPSSVNQTYKYPYCSIFAV